jgi:poly(3-hydroxybutyrate) depolymerase
MGGDDMRDLLSGVDSLLHRGIADPSQLGVTGGSYGGFMSAWIVEKGLQLQSPYVAPGHGLGLPSIYHVECKLTLTG